MFLLRKTKNNFQLCTLIWGPAYAYDFGDSGALLKFNQTEPAQQVLIRGLIHTVESR